MDHRRNGKKRNSVLKLDENYRFSVTDGMVASLKSISPESPSDGQNVDRWFRNGSTRALR